MRDSMDSAKLETLTASIRARGIMLPLIVTPATPAGEPLPSPADLAAGLDAPADVILFEIIDGHRRFVAAGDAGLEELPCRVYENIEDARLGMMLDANAEREEVPESAEGLWILELVEKHNYSMDQLKARFHRSEAWINDRVRLAQDDPNICIAVSERKITAAVGRELLRCKVPEHRAYLLALALQHGHNAATVRYQVEQHKAQLALAAGEPVSRVAAEFQPSAPPPVPACVFCGREDDQQNIRTVPVHWYHEQDLRKLLDQLGIAKHVQQPA